MHFTLLAAAFGAVVPGSDSSEPGSAGGGRDQPSDRSGCLLCRWDVRWGGRWGAGRWSWDRCRSFAGFASFGGSVRIVGDFEAGSFAAC